MEHLNEIQRILADTRVYFARLPAKREQAAAMADIPDLCNPTDLPAPEWDPYEVWRRHILTNV